MNYAKYETLLENPQKRRKKTHVINFLIKKCDKKDQQIKKITKNDKEVRNNI